MALPANVREICQPIDDFLRRECITIGHQPPRLVEQLGVPYILLRFIIPEHSGDLRISHSLLDELRGFSQYYYNAAMYTNDAKQVVLDIYLHLQRPDRIPAIPTAHIIKKRLLPQNHHF